MAERRKQRFVETFIPQATVETFDKAVLLRFSRGDVVPVDFHPIGPFQDRMRREVRFLLDRTLILNGYFSGGHVTDYRDSERAQVGATAADLCCKHGISEVTFCTWRSEIWRDGTQRLLAESVMDVSTLKAC